MTRSMQGWYVLSAVSVMHQSINANKKRFRERCEKKRSAKANFRLLLGQVIFREVWTVIAVGSWRSLPSRYEQFVVENGYRLSESNRTVYTCSPILPSSILKLTYVSDYLYLSSQAQRKDKKDLGISLRANCLEKWDLWHWIELYQLLCWA